MIRHEDMDDGPLCSKPHKVCCVPCYIPCNILFFPCRYAVSGNKQRYMKDGFDLDLTYISPRIVVHGFPATGLEHIYRNPRLEIRRFMDKYHQDKYKTFNFCCEPGRGYDPAVFYNRVERYPFKDHHIPPLETMAAFAESAKAWLEADANRVVNMHCKAGKGRAGVMCCVLLVRNGEATSALDAMAQYDERRVNNRKGLTLTSQRKSVIFYEYLWRNCWGITGNIGKVSATQAAARDYKVPFQPALPLAQVEILHLPTHFLNTYVGQYRVTIHKVTSFRPTLLYDSKNKKWHKTANSNANAQPTSSADQNATSTSSNPYVRQNILAADCVPTILQGNFKIVVYIAAPSSLGSSSWQKLFELQHNTYFMPKKATIVDFGLDQMDMKKSMKQKIFVQSKKEGIDTNAVDQVVLRLKFDFSQISDELAQNEDQLLFYQDYGYASSHTQTQYMRLGIADDDEYDCEIKEHEIDDDKDIEFSMETFEQTNNKSDQVSIVADSNADNLQLASATPPSSAVADTNNIEMVFMVNENEINNDIAGNIVVPDIPKAANEGETSQALAPTEENLESNAEDHAETKDSTEVPKKRSKSILMSNPLFKMVGRARKSIFGKKAPTDPTTSTGKAEDGQLAEKEETALTNTLDSAEGEEEKDQEEEQKADHIVGSDPQASDPHKEGELTAISSGTEESVASPPQQPHTLVEDAIETGRFALQFLTDALYLDVAAKQEEVVQTAEEAVVANDSEVAAPTVDAELSVVEGGGEQNAVIIQTIPTSQQSAAEIFPSQEAEASKSIDSNPSAEVSKKSKGKDKKSKSKAK